MIKHIVIWKVKGQTKVEQKVNVDGIREKLESMQGKIDEIESLQTGADVVRGEQSFDVCLITTHESIEKLKAYQAHPVHQEVVAFLRTVTTQKVSVDFEY